jgi:membrane protease YdiL (CAAX protease family)
MNDCLEDTIYQSTTDRALAAMKHFALTAAIFEGSLVVLAVVLGWLLAQPPLKSFRFEWSGALLGLAATLPPLGLFLISLKCPWRPFQGIARIVDETLVPLFKDCRLVELAIIAALAGIGEEMLFRGVIQTAVAEEIGGPYGVWLGLIIAAVLFGLLHPITPTYAVLAGLIGLYLGWLWLWRGNLLTPITTHGLYDFLALLYLVKLRGKR